MSNEKLDIPLLLALMWSSFALYAQTAAPPSTTVIAAVTPSVWTEGVMIALITSSATLIISLATLIIGVFKMNRIAETVDVVKQHTNSMTTELAKAKLAEGHAIGMQQQKGEQAIEEVKHAAAKQQGRSEAEAEAAMKATPTAALPVSDAAPTPVKVVASVPVPVVETPTKPNS